MQTAGSVGRRGTGGSWLWAVMGTLAVLGMTAGAPAFAEEGEEQPPITRVEEDWVLDIGAPDPNTDSPQIINVISYCGCITGAHAVFELNHRTLPTYNAGGMQLQTWISEYLYDSRVYPRYEKLDTADEEIRYTLSMALPYSDWLRFEVKNGTSNTWGAFGGQGYLRSTMWAPYAHLEHYDPALSAKNSRIAFAAHRVKKFALKEVRYYAADGSLIKTDQTERVVHAHEAQAAE
ncbi:MAG: hypothetical protein WD066_06285 [Planctomycetaceae bacterium]